MLIAIYAALGTPAEAATGVFRPDADGTATDWATGGSSTTGSFWDNTDDDPDASDGDATYVDGPNTEHNVRMWVALSGLPPYFASASTVEIKVGHREIYDVADNNDDRIALEYQIVESDGSTTAITAPTAFGFMADNGADYETDAESVSITGANTASSWGAAHLMITQTYDQVAGPDPTAFGRISSIEVNVTYTPSVRHWVGTQDGGDGTWDDPDCWAASSGGAGGAGVPSPAETAVFDAGRLEDATIDATVTVGGIDIQSGYTNTLTQNTGVTIAVGLGSFVQADGTLAGSDASIGIDAELTLSGGTFTSTSGVLTIAGDFVQSGGTFAHNNGTLRMAAAANVTLAVSDPVNNIEFGAAVSQTNLLAHFAFEGNGNDSSGNGNHATGQNFEADEWVPGKVGSGAVELDGVDDYLKTADTDSMNIGGDYTVSLWLFANAAQNSWAGIYTRTPPAGGTNQWNLQFASSGAELYVYHGISLWTPGITAGDLQDAWHHVAIRRSGSTMTAYLDGVEVANSTLVANPISATGHFLVGADNSENLGYIFSGKVDELLVYDRALSGEYIGALAGTSGITLGADLDVQGDLTVETITLDVGAGSYSIDVAGNWACTGTFVARSGTVTLSGTAGTVTSSGCTFSSLTVPAGSTYTATDDLATLGVLTVDGELELLQALSLYTTTSFQDGISPTATYAGTADCSNSQASPTVNNGSADVMWVMGSTDVNCAFLKWDVSTIPSSASVLSATIALVCTANSSVQDYHFYECKRDWVEGSGTTGSGLDYNTYDGASTWQAGGGVGADDKGSSVLGTIVSPGGAETAALNAAGTALVEDWVAGGGNHGVILVNEAATDNARFDTRDTAAPASRPKLTVSYGGAFAGLGTVEFAGTVAQTVPVLPGGARYPTLLISNTHVSGATLGGDVSATNVTVASGATLACGTATFSVGGDFTGDGTFSAGTSTVVFDGTTTLGGTTSATFDAVTVTGSASVAVATSATVGGTLQVGAAASLTVQPDVTLQLDTSTTLDGSLTLQQRGTLQLADGVGVVMSGTSTFVATGASANAATVTSPGTCDVELAGDVAATFLVFEKVSATGVVLSGSGAASVTMEDIRFSNNAGGVDSTHLAISGTDWNGYTFDACAFEGTGANDPTYAITISSGGTVTCTNYDTAAGHIYGDTYDNESNGVVIWNAAGRSLNYSASTFTESGSNDGSMGSTINITLVNDTFTGSTGEDMIASSKITVSGVPTGLTLTSLRSADGTNLMLSFTGNAASHADVDDVGDLSITFLDTAFSAGSAATVTNYDRSDLVIDFMDANAAPTDITLTSQALAENLSAGTSVGTLGVVDPDAGDAHTYQLWDTGSYPDNASFAIVGTDLQTAATLDFETKASYQIQIRVTDQGGAGLTYDELFTVTVTDANDLPTSSDNTVTTSEDVTLSLLIGDFAFVDQDGTDSLQGVQITQIPVTGDLQLSTVSVIQDQVIPVTNITAGDLTFVPVADGNGSPYTTFQFEVNDGTANSAAAYVMTVDVGAVPDIVSLVADDPNDGDTVYSVGDTITLTFDMSTDVSTDVDFDDEPAATMDTYFALSGVDTWGDSADTYDVSWSTSSILVITVKSVSSASLTLTSTTLTLNAAANVFDSTSTYGPSTDEGPALGGDWGQVVAPLITSITASDPTDDDDILDAGDTITIVFDRTTDEAVSGTRTGTQMNALFSLSNTHTFGDGTDSYTLSWSDSLTLVITLDTFANATVDVGDTLTILADADIQTDAGSSPCTDNAAIAGTWGTAAANTLVFTTQPVTTLFNDTIAPATVVEARYPSGVLASAFTGEITLAIGNDPNDPPTPSVLTYTSPVYAVAGVATFGDLAIDSDGYAFTLVASASGFADVTSDAFDIMPSPPSITSVTVSTATAETYEAVTVDVVVADGSRPVNVEIDFGDGSLVYAEALPDGTNTLSVDHEYQDAGTWWITVTALDLHNRSDVDATESVVISDDLTPPVITVTAPADGSTTYDDVVNIVGTADEPVQSVTVDGISATLSLDKRDWYVAVPLTPGAHALTVEGTDLAGVDSVPFIFNVTRVYTPISVTLTQPTDTQVILGDDVEFAAIVSDGVAPYDYQWDFGDGSPVDTNAEPVHSYGSTGYYLLTLTVTDSNFDVGSETVVLDLNVVLPDLVPDLQFTPISPKAQQRVTFDATGSTPDDKISWYFWDWDYDGTTPVFDQYSRNGLVTHVWATYGAQHVLLQIEDQYGQTERIEVYVPVSANGELAVLDSNVTAVNFSARPGVARIITHTVTLSNTGLPGSVAAVTVDVSGLPAYLSVSPMSLAIEPETPRQVQITLDASLATPGVEESFTQTLTFEANGSTSTADVDVSVDLSPYGEGGCAAGTTGGGGPALPLIVMLIAALVRARRREGAHITSFRFVPSTARRYLPRRGDSTARCETSGDLR